MHVTDDLLGVSGWLVEKNENMKAFKLTLNMRLRKQNILY